MPVAERCNDNSPAIHVNIAVNILDDAMHGRVEQIIVVSGDSDLEPAVEWVRKNRPTIKITVYIPCIDGEQHKRRNDFYPGIGEFYANS